MENETSSAGPSTSRLDTISSKNYTCIHATTFIQNQSTSYLTSLPREKPTKHSKLQPKLAQAVPLWLLRHTQHVQLRWPHRHWFRLSDWDRCRTRSLAAWTSVGRFQLVAATHRWGPRWGQHVRFLVWLFGPVSCLQCWFQIRSSRFNMHVLLLCFSLSWGG